MGGASTRDTVQQEDARPPPPTEWALTVLYTPDPARRGGVLRLARAPMKIGRKVPGDGDLGVDDPAVSKVHAELSWSTTRQAYLLVDQGSSNGTHLGGRRIEREVLRAGDVIRLGDTVLRFSAYDADGDGWRAPPGSLLIGRSAALHRVLDRIARAAPAPVTVLVLGETGTGKELVAQSLHAQSGRSGPLRALNCAAIARELVESELFGHVRGAFSGADAAHPGLFRAAEGGTLFLDEVGELSEEVQAKLLRALETRAVRAVGATAEQAVDVRVVAATNRALEAEVEAGRFRADLFARLAEWEIALLPLRERPEDLWPLWEHLAAVHAGGRRWQVPGPVFEALALHRWPYNVRELARLLKSLALARPEGGKLELDDLPEAMRPAPPALAPTPAPEATESPQPDAPTARELRRLVEEYKGNVKEVAAFLGKDRTQVYRWLKRYDIDPDAYR